MGKNKILFFLFYFFVIGISECKFDNYGINNWFWDLGTINLLKKAHILNYRVFVNWAEIEPEDDLFTWNGTESSERYNDFEYTLTNLRAANRFAKDIVKVTLFVYGIPSWVKKENSVFFTAQKYSDFVVSLLKYCDTFSKGLIQAIEVSNITEDVDFSDSYSEILKMTYQRVKEYNKEVIVLTAGIKPESFSNLEALYQLGLKGYFDKISFQYVFSENSDSTRDPSFVDSRHFPTVLAYLKYIITKNSDASGIWLTEIGWNTVEDLKIKYIEYTFDILRKSLFAERVYYMTATNSVEKSSSSTTCSLINTVPAGSDYEYGIVPVVWSPNRSYERVKKYIEKYPVWNKKESIPLIPKANTSINIINPDFESGSDGWTGNFEIDNTVKYSGNSSAKIKIPGVLSCKFKIESEKFYEVSFYVKVVSEKGIKTVCLPSLTYLSTSGEAVKKENLCYKEISSTEKFINGWRKIVFPVVPPKGISDCELRFESKGQGSVFIDNLKVETIDLYTQIK